LRQLYVGKRREKKKPVNEGNAVREGRGARSQEPGARIQEPESRSQEVRG